MEHDNEPEPQIEPDRPTPDEAEAPAHTPSTGSVVTDAPPLTDAPPMAEPPPPIGHRTLRRPVHGRMLGGVAAGIAQYFDIDVVLVRAAFVVLAIFGGSGVLAYLVGWVLIPSDGEGADHTGANADESTGVDGAPGHRRSRVLFIVFAVLAALAFFDLFSSGPWFPHWGWGVAPGFWLFFVAMVLLVLIVSRQPGGSAAARLRRLLLALVVAAVALLAVALATVLTAEALTGVPLRGGIGDSRWQPSSAAQLPAAYRLAVGQLDVDLRNVTFPAGTTHVTASVGIGQVVVEVPPGPAVSVIAHSGMGNVWVFGQDNGGFGATRSLDSVGTGEMPGAHVVLDVQAGLGQVRIVRGS
jgi:phage shock protein PspC (stress-responsive transcriptional regulator)